MLHQTFGTMYDTQYCIGGVPVRERDDSVTYKMMALAEHWVLNGENGDKCDARDKKSESRTETAERGDGARKRQGSRSLWLDL